MLKLLRRKSFRKSKDLNTEHSLAVRRPGGPGTGSTSGQYSVRQTERQRQRRHSGLQSTASLNQSQETARDSGSLDRAEARARSRDNVRNLRSRYSSLSNSVSASETEPQPPEILQYARPPENLASPVRESNGYLAETSPVSLNPGPETTVQKLFFDSVVNGNISTRKSSLVNVKSSPGDKSPYSEGESSPSELQPKVGVKESSVEAGELRTEAVIVREGVVCGAPPQSHPYIRRSSTAITKNTAVVTNNNNNNNTNNNNNKSRVAAKKQDAGQGGRRSVMTALRQSFRRSKKERPVVNKPAANTFSKVNTNPAVISQNPLGRPLIDSRSGSTEDHTGVSVASVRASRTLTPSRASIVSRSSLAGASRGSLAETKEQSSGSLSRRASSARPRERESGECPPEGGDMKTVTSPGGGGMYHGATHRASVTSKSSSYSSGAKPEAGSSATPSATPRQPGQRFLPETPKLGTGAATAVPPIYANVHQQMAAGNNRQMTPGIAKILEDSGNKRHTENGMSRSTSGQSSVSRTPSTEHRGPPAIPKPAARMSLRQKVARAQIGQIEGSRLVRHWHEAIRHAW